MKHGLIRPPRLTRPLLRPFLACLALLCLTLPACVPVATIQSNNLPAAPAAQATQRPPAEMAYIVHLYGMPGSHSGADDSTYNYLYSSREEYTQEAKSWTTTLTALAAPDHILITEQRSAPPLQPGFAEFCRTHPVVDIYNHPDYRRTGAFSYIVNLGAFALDTASLGLLPLRYQYHYTAEFRLTLPPEHQDTRREDPEHAPSAPAVQQGYAYLRREHLSPLLFLPLGDKYSLCDELPACTFHPMAITELAAFDLSDWRTQEKRQLMAQFLRDIRPQLEQYAQRMPPAPSPPAGAR